VQASNQFTENNAEAGSSKDFSLAQKKSSCAQDDNGHQSTTYLKAVKQGLKRKGPELLNAKLSTRQTKSRRVKSRFSCKFWFMISYVRDVLYILSNTCTILAYFL
jgi:hypothetical protein